MQDRRKLEKLYRYIIRSGDQKKAGINALRQGSLPPSSLSTVNALRVTGAVI
jgi:hypothetical protein